MIDYTNSEKRLSRVWNVLLRRNSVYISSNITDDSQLVIYCLRKKERKEGMKKERKSWRRSLKQKRGEHLCIYVSIQEIRKLRLVGLRSKC